MRELSVIEIENIAGGDAQSDAIAQAIASGLIGAAVVAAMAAVIDGSGVPYWWFAFPIC